MPQDILIVEDEDYAARQYGRTINRRLRIEPFVETSPLRALEIVDQHTIKVLIVDQKMPELTGTQLVREVQKKHPDIVSIMLTGRATKEEIGEALNLGFFRYIDKGKATDELVPAVEEALRQYDDLVELKEESEPLVNDSKLSKEYLQIVGRITGQYAHAMTTPLSAIELGIEDIKSCLQKIQLGQDFSSTLEDIQIAIGQIKEQVNDFSSIAKEGNLTEINLNDIISQVVRVAKVTTKWSKDIQFTPEEIPPFRCYASRLVTALIAITENALEAISTDGYVEISTGYNSAGKNVSIIIKDNGPGIPEDIQNKVWEEFFTTKERNSGIGLSIAKDIIENELRGEVRLESKEGKGTTFFIKLNTEVFEQ